MCLDSISFFKPKKSGVGYKVFYLMNGRPYGVCYNHSGKDTFEGLDFYELNKWYEASKGKISYSGVFTKSYPTGFHIFPTLFAVNRWMGPNDSYKMYKVEYEDAHTKGEQEECAVVVAKRMKLLEEVNATEN